MAKRFFLVSAAILMLAIAYSLGTKNAEAQNGPTIVGFASSSSMLYAITSSGDVYQRVSNAEQGWGTPLVHTGNFWDGTVNVQSETWSGMKEKYRK